MEADLVQLLQSGLSRWQLDVLHKAASEATSRALPLYVVGGLVRDLVLTRAITDFDLVVEGDAIRLARALAIKFGGQVKAHPRFGTAKWIPDRSRPPSSVKSDDVGASREPPHHIDFISARSETYPKAAQLPEVRPGGIDDDLRRRDFTINTLAVRLDGLHYGHVHDPFGGLGDLERGIVRVLHEDSFQHDPTRMYRAVRYEKRYGFKIAPETLALVPPARAHVRQLSAQRIRQELDRILEEQQATSMLLRLAGLELLQVIHPALPTDSPSLRRLRDVPVKAHALIPGGGPNLRWLLWLIELSPAQIRSLHRRLRFRKELLEDLLAVTRLNREAPAHLRARPSQITAYLEGFRILAVHAAHSGASSRRTRAVLGQYLERWRTVSPATTGKDLRRLGLPPGPAYRLILSDLRNGWLDGLIRSPAEEQARLELLLRWHLKAGAKTSIPNRTSSNRD